MKFHRPGSVSFVAQVCIWGGLLVFASGLYMALARWLSISDLAAKAETLYEKNPDAFLVGYANFYADVMPIFPIVIAVVGLLLFGSGLGMLKMRRWSRRLAIFFCFLLIVLFLADLAYQYAVVLPALHVWFTEYRLGPVIEAEAPAIQFVMEAGIAASIMPLFMIAMALVLWHIMRQPMFANTLVFANPVKEKPRRAEEIAMAEPLPAIPPRRVKEKHRSRKDRSRKDPRD